MTSRGRATLLLVIGILGVSSASLWIRMSGDQPGQLAFRRLFLALPFLAIWAKLSGAPVMPGPGKFGRLLVPGLALAAHFYLWIASLEYLPVSVSVLLVTLHPIIVFAVEWGRRKLRANKWAIVGMLCALGGAVMLAWPQEGLTTESREDVLAGVALAVGGAIAMAAYLLGGRVIQGRMRTPTYVLSVYGIAALVLGLYEYDQGHTLLPTSPNEWWFALLLALLPTVFGHTPMNAALRMLPATVISVAFLGEAVMASLIVWFYLGEVPPMSILWGGPLLAVGIILTGRHIAARRS